MKTTTMGRRALLRGLGGVSIGLPFLGATMMGTRTVSASPATFPTRLITFYTPNGFDSEGRPSGLDLTGTTLEALAPHAGELTLMRGIDMASGRLDPNPNDGSHYNGWAHLLVGDDSFRNPSDSAGRTAGNVSFDMLAADHICTDTRFRSSLHTVDGEGYALSSLGANMPALPEPDPSAAFTRLFSDLDADPAALDRIRLRRQSILDFTREQANALHCRLGTEDRTRLEAHLDAIRDVESRLDPAAGLVGGGLCALPAAPAAGLSYPAAGQAHMDLLVMALTCDLTRVGSMQWGRPAATTMPSWLGIDESHHDLSHQSNATARGKIRDIDRWYAGQLAYLLARMKAIPEGDGTLLDHSIVLWVTEGSEGGHGRDNVEVVVAGGGNGKLRTGQYLDLPGVTHNDVLLELLNAVLPAGTAPYATFGNPAACTGGVAELRV